MLSDEEIQDIRNRAKLNDNRQIEPMAFARDIERAVLAKAAKQEPVGYVVVGQGISFYKTTLEEANHQANSLEWRDDKKPIIYPVFKSYPIALDQKEIWFRRVEVQGYPVEHLVMSYKGAGDVGPFYSAPVQAQPQIAAIPDGYVHVDEVIQLCEDFSSRAGSIYIGDVQAALRGLSPAPKPGRK